MPYKIIDKCRRCKNTFNPWSAPPHFTIIHALQNEVCVVFPFCEPCWNETDEEDKRAHYYKMWSDWQDEGYPTLYEATTGPTILSSWALISRGLNIEINKEYKEKMQVVNGNNQE